MSVEGLSPKPENRVEYTPEKRAAFDEFLATLTPDSDAYTYITSLSILLMEPDKARDFRANVDSHLEVTQNLTERGLNQEQISDVLEYFGVPKEKKEVDDTNGI